MLDEEVEIDVWTCVTLTLVDVGAARRWSEASLIAQCYGDRDGSRISKDA